MPATLSPAASFRRLALLPLALLSAGLLALTGCADPLAAGLRETPATLAVAASPAAAGLDPRLAPYVAALELRGQDPVRFVLEQLQTHDLVIFDDALHSAVEPFDFYRQLVRTPEVVATIDALYLELLPVSHQAAVDAYLAAETEDPALLDPAFQDDTGGLGFPYQTYYDLLRTVWEVNRTLAPEKRLRVVGVNTPTWWSEMRTPEDVEHYRRFLSGRDHLMYQLILDDLGAFEAGRKGLFLTNTRHAYKDVRRPDGTPYWNTGTFFHRWHPGRTCSLRLHNVSLFIEGQERATGAGSIEGLDRYRYRWGRMEDGLWDSAYDVYRQRVAEGPVAVPLTATPFGDAAYVGNHMHRAAPGQRMVDAYDAVIFLAPLESMRQTAHRGALYTEAFRREVARRFRLLHPGEAADHQLAAHGVDSLEELVDELVTGRPEEPLSLVAAVGPADGWR